MSGNIFLSDKWQHYELLDASDFNRLERWGDYILVRPDPSIVWTTADGGKRFAKKAGAIYQRSVGAWRFLTDIPHCWTIKYEDLKFIVKPTNFKHTGLFPEQAVNWSWVRKKVKPGIKILNLFAYTGAASVSAAKVGATVCHVDACRGVIEWAKKNANLSAVSAGSIRYIVDDVVKFVSREIKRNSKYDGVIMDPPSYGRGPNSETWKIEKHIFHLLELCAEVMVEKPSFFLLNSYTTGLSEVMLRNVINLTIAKKFGGVLETGELVLPCTKQNVLLPCGYTGRWCLK